MFDTDYNWRLNPKGGPRAMRRHRIFDAVQTWLLSIAEVCTDLATLIPTGRRERTTAATFSKGGSTDSSLPCDDNYGAVLFRMRGSARNLLCVQVSAGRKNCLHPGVDGTKSSLC